MRIIVSGWGRSHGKKEIMDAPLALATTHNEKGKFSFGETYLQTIGTESFPARRVQISTGVELRLGGNYRLEVELSRADIAHLFYKTHSGDIVRMFRSFVENDKPLSAPLPRRCDIEDAP